MNEIKVLGVKVNRIEAQQALEKIEQWVRAGKKHQIVTTNIEFIMSAQNDPEFKKILNGADLSIPDSSRFGWVESMMEANIPTKVLIWPFFLFPKKPFVKGFPVVTGTDLMLEICKLASKNGWKIGLIGGKEKVVEKAANNLMQKYAGLNIVFTESGGEVDQNGFLAPGPASSVSLPSGGPASSLDFRSLRSPRQDLSSLSPLAIVPSDILFVAFGHIKQEKWIKNYMSKVDSKVFMGVGGALDYISGNIPRAPKLLRDLGFEWLFRLFVQPWRIKRFLNLLRFVFKIW